MKKPKQRMYIDARHEKFERGDVKKATYEIQNIEDHGIKTRLYDAIGQNVLRIEVIPKNEKVIISYHENMITPSFMEYKFQIKKLKYKRVES